MTVDAASAAAQSDPLLNRNFSRRWTESPPLERERPALGPTSNRAGFTKEVDSETCSASWRLTQELDRVGCYLLAEHRAARRRA